MNFSAYSIRNPVPAILLFFMLTLIGLKAFFGLKVQDFPDIELPIVTVSASLPGSAPAQLETEVARKLEDSIANLQGLKNTYTRVLDGEVTVTAEFELEKKISDAVNDVRDAVSTVRADLPAEMRDPTVSKVSTAGRAIVTYIVTPSSSASAAPLSTEAAGQISWLIDNTVTKRLLSVKGVGAVKRIGGTSREILIELDPQKMAALGVSALDVSRQIKRVQQEKPAGRADISGAEQAIRTIATAASVSDIAQLEIPLTDGRRVQLSQIALVQDTHAEKRALATYNGKEVVAFEVFRTKGAGEVDVEKGAAEAIATLQKEYPTLQFKEVINNAAPIQENYKASMNLLYEGALLAIIVIFVFLKDWRAMLVATAALPLSVIPTFIALQYFGYTLNTVTLLSLALVVGVLVDDAIVEIENIERHLAMGKKPFDAAMEAADEIGMAVIATTFALIAVFLPTAFMGGVPGLFFKQFGWTAVVAIFASLVVARLLTPMMAAYILKPKPLHTTEDGVVMRGYLRAVGWCLRHRVVTIVLAILFFVASIGIIRFLPTGFVPASDRNQTQITIELPPGSTLAQTTAVAEQVRQLAATVPHVQSVFSSIGGGTSGDAFVQGAAAEARRAVLTITTTHRKQRHESLPDIEKQIRSKLTQVAGARFNVGPPDTGTKMQLVLKSEDPQALLVAAKQVERELRTLSGIGNVSSSASLVRPEVKIKPDLNKAADLGVTADNIGDTVRVATMGDYTLNLSKLNLAERQIPIRVKLPDAIRQDLNALAQLQVPSSRGSVLLGNVAQLEMSSGPAQIDRLNRSRNVTLDVELGSRTLGEVNAAAHALSSVKNLPPSVSIAELGDAEEMKKLFASFGGAMLIGLFCIIGILILLFRNFFQPLTIISAIPFSAGGAFLALLLAGKSLSMPSMIGLIMLMGIVTKNSILLIDYVELARQRGDALVDALIDACHKRARPIVMTTIAMVAGMMPLALGWGADPSFRSPMAVTVIGGLITSTFLSLLVVPVVYSMVNAISLKPQYTTENASMASVYQRLVNWLIDTVAVVVLIKITVALCHMLGVHSLLFLIPIGLMMYVWYYTLLEFYFGKTLGKLITKTRVANAQKDSVRDTLSFTQCMLRSLLRLIPFESLSLLTSDQGTPAGVHDRWSKTVVVRD